MAKMEVILTHNVVGLGGESDQVKVASGYARNFLFPQGLAVPQTAANKRRLDVLRQRRAERESSELNTMSELGRNLSKMVLSVLVKTGDDGKMFGSVTAGTIADELKHQFEVALDKKKIHLDHPIRTLGDHEIELRLHAEVHATLKVQVKSANPPPPPVVTQAEAGKDAVRRDRQDKQDRRERRPRTEREKKVE